MNDTSNPICHISDEKHVNPWDNTESQQDPDKKNGVLELIETYKRTPEKVSEFLSETNAEHDLVALYKTLDSPGETTEQDWCMAAFGVLNKKMAIYFAVLAERQYDEDNPIPTAQDYEDSRADMRRSCNG